MAETIIKKDAIELYEHDMSLYSIIVNRKRSLPSINDGLKVVQRRIVYQAYKDGLYKGRNKKSSQLDGEIMGNLHPHASSYNSIVNLANWFTTKYPIMSDCKTGYGSADGASASAPRYTHAGLSDFGFEALIEDFTVSEKIVNWIDTYLRDGSLEPEYLPAKIPELLVNGSYGIGLGLIISIPSHNLGEVIDVTRKLLKDPNAKFCLIPDLCQSCELLDTDWQAINDTGSGQFKARGRIDIETDKKSGDYVLHIRSLPPQVSGDDVYNKILDLVDAKKLPMVKDVFSTLVKEDNRPDVIIHLRPGSDPEYVKQILFAQTPVSQTIPVDFQAVTADGLETKRFSYRDYLLHFIDFRATTKFRLYSNKLQQVDTRRHVLDALIKVLESKKLDEIISMIRKQKTIDDNRIIEYIIKHCGTTDVQAKFIIGIQLGKLSLAHLNTYKDEYKNLTELYNKYLDIVLDENATFILQEIDQELLEIKKKYDTPRICNVISASEASNIPPGMFKIVITENNFIRKIPDNDKITVVKKDNPKLVLRIDNTENLLIFDNKGRVFMLPVHKIQVCDKSSVGQDIRFLLKNCTADIISVFNENIFKQVSKSGNKHYLTVLTRKNLIKKMDIEDFLTIPSSSSGFVYSKVAPDDQVVSLALIAHGLDIVVGSNHKVLRFNLKEVSVVKRNAFGVIAMRTDDNITGMSILYPDTSDIIVVTKNGKFNRFSSNMMTPHKRATGGQNCIKLDSTDEIFAILAASSTDSIKITTLDGVEVIPVNTIKEKSPIAPGQRYIQSKSQVLKAEIIRG